MRAQLKLYLFSILLGFSSVGQSEEWREFYSNARALGMGNASVAVTNDETALILNPAALGRLRDDYGTLFDPEYDTSSNTIRQYKNIGLGNNFEISRAKELTDNFRESYYHHRAQIFPSFVRKYVGLGMLYRVHLDAEMNAAGDKLYVNYRNDIALVGGLSFRLFDGRIKLGINGKIISRIEVQNSNVSPTGNLDIPSIGGGGEGMGLSTDSGILIAAPWTWIPTIGAVIHDMGGTTFTARRGVRMNTSEAPQQVPQTIDVAVALFPIHSKDWRSSWTLEYKDITNGRGDDDNAKRMHFGVEYNWADIFFIRAGYNQRYWTAGLELASENMQWQLASYGEEIGTKSSPREDRRYVAKVAFRF